MGLSLFNLPPGLTVRITAVIEDGSVKYTETAVVDQCGTATPFVKVSVDDLGGMFNDWAWGVYAMAGEEYLFEGVLLSEDPADPPETPISTQWEWSDEAGDFVAIEGANGVMIGLWMMP